ncbi:hypothetical protein HW555_000926, partial [Spodoptera exigua]
STVQLQCDVSPAPFMLRPYAGLYNPFPLACSVLCNHPADTEARDVVKKAKDHWIEGKGHYFQEDLSKFQDGGGGEKDKNRTPHDIFTEDMFRRYAETDSRPLTPAPTLASGKSRGSRRCLTPDQPHQRTTIVLDLRRSHSQETIYYHGYATSDVTGGPNTSPTNDRSTLPSLNLSDATHNRLLMGQNEQLPPLASPFVLSRRTVPVKEPQSVRILKKHKDAAKDKKSKEKSFFVTGDTLATLKSRRLRRNAPKLPTIVKPGTCDCGLMHLTRIVISYAPKSRKRGASNIVLSMTAWGTTGQRKRMKLPSVKLTRKLVNGDKSLTHNTDEFFKKLENQLKALNIGKPAKNKNNKVEQPPSQRSKTEKESNEANEAASNGEEGGMRGKRRKKGRQGGGSDRLTSAGLAAQAQQDPETQIAGIGTDSQNPSSRGSIAPAEEDDVIVLPVIKPLVVAKKSDSFLDDDMLKFLHREVDEEAIETEFNTKRRYVLEEAMRTRPDRAYGQEMQALLKELKVPAVSLGDWLHIPRVFSRKNAQFSLPIDTNALEDLTPMNYAARYVTLKKSKQLLYLTVLRKFREHGYRMPIKNIEEGLIMMMGGSLTAAQASSFGSIMDWNNYEEEENIPDDIKVTLVDKWYKKPLISTEAGDAESDENTIKYRTWCGLCAICERMYGRFPPRDNDPPDGIELSDFSMVESKLVTLKVNSGLREILNVIRER